MTGSQPEWSGILEKAILVVREASAFIRANRNTVGQEQVEVKSVNSLVSYVDKKAENILVSGLQSLLPEAGFITEEATTGQSSKEYTWIIDPLDGTTNFLHDIPLFCVSVALVKDNTPVIGIVHEIVADEMFWAIAGSGAFLNGQPIRVSGAGKIEDVLFATGFPYEKKNLTEAHFTSLKKILSRTRGIRRLGTAAADLCYVACGRFGVYYETSLNPWDVAAGGLIVTEAGGKVTTIQKKDTWLSGESILAFAPGLETGMDEVLSDFIEAGPSPFSIPE
jgi:myo-inositol-1(or 4)-monophosphatase